MSAHDENTPEYDVLEFTTTSRPRETEPTPITLCGEEVTARRPKDFVLFTAQSALSEVATDSDKAMAMLQILNSSLTDVARHRVIERICDTDDPLTAGAAYQMIDELTDRWSPETNTPTNRPIIIKPHPDTAPPAKPVRVRLADIEVLCTPPKDLVLHIVASGLASGVSRGHQVWCVILFLDAALTPMDANVLKHRLRSAHDGIDLSELMEVVQGLMEHWYPNTDMNLGKTGNRKQRRASAKKRKSGRVVEVAPAETDDSGQSELFHGG